MIKHPVHPAERYVNLVLLDLLHSGRNEWRAKSSDVLPALSDQPSPDFARLRNRLKVMAELDPVLYPTPRTGSFQIAVDRKVDGQWFVCTYAVTALFTDVGDDPSVEVRAELISQEPGIDPDLRLD